MTTPTSPQTGTLTATVPAPVRHAFLALYAGFVAAPLLAGLDKFAGLMTDWTRYLWPGFADLLGVSPGAFMSGVGVVEIVAAGLVAFKPRLGALVVAGWLVGIIANLVLVGGFLDVALRDLGLALGAFALARLAAVVRPG